MSKLHDVRMKVRRELEAPPALRRFGSGWISGVLGIVLGVIGLSLVLAILMPGTFAIPETQGLYAKPVFRVGLHVLLLAAFGLSALSLALRPGKTLGTCGVAVTLLAAMLGGSDAKAAVPDATPLYFGLDFLCCGFYSQGFCSCRLNGFFHIVASNMSSEKSGSKICFISWSAA